MVHVEEFCYLGDNYEGIHKEVINILNKAIAIFVQQIVEMSTQLRPFKTNLSSYMVVRNQAFINNLISIFK